MRPRSLLWLNAEAQSASGSARDRIGGTKGCEAKRACIPLRCRLAVSANGDSLMALVCKASMAEHESALCALKVEVDGAGRGPCRALALCASRPRVFYQIHHHYRWNCCTFTYVPNPANTVNPVPSTLLQEAASTVACLGLSRPR